METKIKKISFTGGGVKGIAYAGALSELEKHPDIFSIKGITHVVGSSAGAIAALIVALGYSVSEMEDKLEAINFTQLTNPTMEKPQNLREGFDKVMKVCENSYEYHALSSHDDLEVFIKKLIKAKVNDENITFNELKKKIGKSLCVTVTDLYEKKSIYISDKPEEYSDTPVWLGVLSSASAPPIYEALKVKPISSNSSSCSGFQLRTDGRYTAMWIDGGLTENNPAAYFKNDYEDLIILTFVGAETMSINKPFLALGNGLCWISRVRDALGMRAKNSLGIFRKVGRIIKLNSKTHFENERYLRSEGYLARTIEIETGGIEFHEFALSKQKKAKLKQYGKDAVIKHFTKKWPKYNKPKSKLSYSK